MLLLFLPASFCFRPATSPPALKALFVAVEKHEKAFPKRIHSPNSLSSLSPSQLYLDDNPYKTSLNTCDLQPAVTSCQEFAQQACLNPSIGINQASQISMIRLKELPEGSNVSFETCSRQRKCTPDDINCQRFCMTSCLLNTEILCLRKVCGNSIVQAVSLADTKKPLPTDQTMKWMRSFLYGDKMCSDDALIAGDKILIGNGGLTYTKSLLLCAKNFFNPQSTTLNQQLDHTCEYVLNCGTSQIVDSRLIHH
jgi:hypothetical protein